MIAKFRAELVALETYFSKLETQQLTINQCEITYINHIPRDDGLSPSMWIRLLNVADGNQQDDFSLTVRNVIRDADGKPLGRLIVEAKCAVTKDNKQVIQLNLTIRGAPQGTRIENAIEFLCSGRDRIVTKFAEITTDIAHQKWERIQ